VVDYPNSNKAKKVFLCLFVGGGGGLHQVPKGLEGEDGEVGEKVKFERRREREHGREKAGKRKNIKDKDWILKKKEVSCNQYRLTVNTALRSSTYSCTDNAERKAFRATQNLQVVKGDQYSEQYSLSCFITTYTYK
jgi:Methyltransferase involved in Williams-Beuren syndrome.